MKSTTRIQLSIMMFLEFFIWGAWFVTMGTFLAKTFSATGGQMAMAYETQSIGAIVAPFIIGLIADRYFSAQKILGVLHLLGAGLLYMAGTSDNFDAFYPYILIYMILYMPTLALVNSVAFRQMKDPAKDFALTIIPYLEKYKKHQGKGKNLSLGAYAKLLNEDDKGSNYNVEFQFENPSLLVLTAGETEFFVISNDPPLETALPGKNFNELGFGVVSV